MKTVKKLAQDALEVQDACNLIGVAISFSQALLNLRDLFPGLSTSQINAHPIAVLYSSKIASLTYCEDSEIFSEAYAKAKELAK